MRILVTRFPYESQLGGEEWHTIVLAEKLRKRGHFLAFAGSCKILLASLKKRNFETENYWGGTAVVSKKAILIFPFTALFILINFLRILLYFKLKRKIDVVYMLSLNEKLLMTPLALILGMKVVWVEHARIGNWLTKNPFLFIYKLWLKWVDVVCVSKQQGEQLKFAKSLKVITNGVDGDFFKPLEVDKISYFETKGIKIVNSQKLIGAVARLSTDKGIDVLIKAFSSLNKKISDTRLIVVGTGVEELNLKKLSNDLKLQDKIIFLEEVSREEMSKFYNCLDVFVLASTKQDPFGLVVAEAMACKKPVIVTDVCGIADSMDNCENGLIVEADNSQQIYEALLKILSDNSLTKKLGLAGYELFKNSFSLERMVDEYELLIKGQSESKYFKK